jgi:hypothetical protein
MKKQGAKKAGGATKKDGTAKKVGARKTGGASLSSSLRSLTEGLSYQSETDYPVEPYVRKAVEGAPTAEGFAAGREGEDAAVRELNFDSFFGTATLEEDGQDEEARANVKKFQALVEFLKGHLNDIKVYRVGDVEADVYVVGKTEAGDFEGVKTKVVET